MIIFSIILLLMTYLSITDSISRSFPFNKTILFQDFLEENKNVSKFMDVCQARIVGGTEVSTVFVPYQVALKEGRSFGMWWMTFCGGTLITLKTVLSAAHCFVTGQKIRKIDGCRAVAGTERTNSLYTEFLSESSRQLLKVWKHQLYDPRTFRNDLAVIQLDEKFVQSESVLPVKIQTSIEDVTLGAGAMCVVSGYGIMDDYQPSTSLRMVCVPIVHTDVCRSYYGMKYVTRSNICAGSKGKDSCQGDSGGPLVCDGVLVGIVSFGGECGAGPGVQTYLLKYTDEEVQLIDYNGSTYTAMYNGIMLTLEIIIHRLQ